MARAHRRRTAIGAGRRPRGGSECARLRNPAGGMVGRGGRTVRRRAWSVPPTRRPGALRPGRVVRTAGRHARPRRAAGRRGRDRAWAAPGPPTWWDRPGSRRAGARLLGVRPGSGRGEAGPWASRPALGPPAPHPLPAAPSDPMSIISIIIPVFAMTTACWASKPVGASNDDEVQDFRPTALQRESVGPCSSSEPLLSVSDAGSVPTIALFGRFDTFVTSAPVLPDRLAQGLSFAGGAGLCWLLPTRLAQARTVSC